MKVFTRPGAPPQRPSKIVFFLFSTVFFFFVHIESKLRKHKRKSIFYMTLFRHRSVEDCQGYRTLVLFLNEISREKVVKKPPRFPFRDWRVHRKHHIKVLHFGTLSIHSSISKWEAWWTSRLFVPNNRVYFARKSWSKSHHASHFETFSVPQMGHLFDTNLFSDLLCVEAFSRRIS